MHASPAQPARRHATLSLAFACAALAACGGGSDSSAPPAAPAPAPVPAPPPPPAPPAGPSWQAASDVSAGPVDIASPSQLAVNAAGDAVAVWLQTLNTRPSVWGASFHPGSGWSTPQLLRASPADAEMPRVGIDALGNAVVVWRDSALSGVPGQTHAMWSVRGTRNGDGSVSWSSGTKLPANREALQSYALAVSPSGTAVLAWREYFPATGGDTVATRNLAVTEGDGVTWSLPAYPESSDGDVDKPVVAIGAAGDAALAWEQAGDSGASQVLASRRTGAGSWSAPQLLTVSGGSTTVVSYDPRVAVAGDGQALVVWQQYEGPTRQLWSSRSAAGGNWSTGAALTAPGVVRRFTDATLAMNAAGQAVLAWGDVSTSYSQVWTRRYSTAGGWAPNEVQASTDGLLNQGEQQVALDSAGRATLMWRGGSGNPHVFARSSDASGQWLGTPQRIDEAGSDTTYTPQVGVDANGNWLAVWSQFTGSLGRLRTSGAK